MGTGESSNVYIIGRRELPARCSTVEKVIAPEKIGARVVEAILIKLVVTAEAEAEAVGVTSFVAAIVVLSIKQVKEETDQVVARDKDF